MMIDLPMSIVVVNFWSWSEIATHSMLEDTTRERMPIDYRPCASAIQPQSKRLWARSNPDSVALTPPQIKRPIGQVQPRLGGSDVTSRATEEPDSLSTLEASRRVLQYSSTAGFSELPNQISTYGLNGFHLRLISSQQILSPANRSNGY